MPHAAPAAVAAPTFTYGASPLLLRPRHPARRRRRPRPGSRLPPGCTQGYAARMMHARHLDHRDQRRLHALAAAVPPHVRCGTRDYCGKSHERCLASSNNTVGFLRRTLEWMNETWPHPGHRLYNGGRPGAGGLANFLGCLSTWVPEEIDLFWFEVGGTGNNMRWSSGSRDSFTASGRRRSVRRSSRWTSGTHASEAAIEQQGLARPETRSDRSTQAHL